MTTANDLYKTWLEKATISAPLRGNTAQAKAARAETEAAWEAFKRADDEEKGRSPV